MKGSPVPSTQPDFISSTAEDSPVKTPQQDPDENVCMFILLLGPTKGQANE